MTEEKKQPVKMEDVQARADEKSCPVQKALTFVEEFLAEPMCGRCFPCSMGSYEAGIRLKNMKDNAGDEGDIRAVRHIASVMVEASMCKKGKDTARYLLKQLDSGEFSGHLDGICPTGECSECIQYIIIPEKCTMCGDCLAVCRDNAIIGEKKKEFLSGFLPFEIAQKRCTKCGECIKVCTYEAIRLVSAKEMAEKETAGV